MRGADPLKMWQGQPSFLRLIEQPEARYGGKPELLQRNAAVEIGVGGRDRFRQVQQSVPSSTFEIAFLLTVAPPPRIIIIVEGG